MTEPLTTATVVVTAASQAVAGTVVTIFGLSLGLRPDILVAGFFGATAGITLLNSVPATGDTLYELLRTSLRRIGVSIGSTMVAGYLAPVVSYITAVPQWLVLGVAFLIGVYAKAVLPWLFVRLGGRADRDIKPADEEAKP